jgi:hypothetical protein
MNQELLRLKTSGRPQYVLNFSDTCSCGRRKDVRLQWCEHCFGLLPANRKSYFVATVERLRRYIASLEAILVKRRVK